MPADKYPFDTRRLRRVLEVAAAKSGWSKRSRAEGRGMGIVAARSFTSSIASVVEVEVDGQGQVRIPRVTPVTDAGTVINPDRVRSQLEGAAVMGVGLAMTGGISAAGDHPDQLPQRSRCRESPTPRARSTCTSSRATPLQAGSASPGCRGRAGALANAIFAATGKRVRELPISKARLV